MIKVYRVTYIYIPNRLNIVLVLRGNKILYNDVVEKKNILYNIILIKVVNI